MMQYVREFWLWLGQHQTAAIVVIVAVAVLIAWSMAINYDLVGALRQLGGLVGQ